MDLYTRFILHSSSEKFCLEPRSDDGAYIENECLGIDRVSNNIGLLPTNQVPSQSTSQTVFGVIGIIRLVAGNYLIVVKRREVVATIGKSQVYKVVEIDILPFFRTTLHLTEEQVQDNRNFLSMAQNMLQTDGFYYCYTYDLTHSLQRLQNTNPDWKQMPLYERADPRFVWNQYVYKDFAVHPELHRYILPLLHGFVETKRCSVNGHPFALTLVSRRSCYRAGVRLFRRGLDEHGHVANYVETEQILEYASLLCSYVQTRGSIPLYWSQHPNLTWLPFPRLTAKNSFDQLLGLRAHIDTEIYNYGRQVLVNLISNKGREKKINEEFEKTIQHSIEQNGLTDVEYIHFDFHKECSKMRWDRLSLLMERLKPYVNKFEYLATSQDKFTAHKLQLGTIRTNCMDCLDRTNVVQSLIAKRVLQLQLEWVQILQPGESLMESSDFDSTFKNLWADNGDMCSVQYAGTGALKADFTRTGVRSTSGLVMDGVNAVKRYFKNNFSDGNRQDSIDLFLGNFVIDESYREKLYAKNSDRGLYMWLPLLALLAFSMTVLTLIFTEELSFAFIWLFLAIVILSVVVYNGSEYVSRPKLKTE